MHVSVYYVPRRLYPSLLPNQQSNHGNPMTIITHNGEKREIDDAAYAEFISKHSKPAALTAHDYYQKALVPTGKDEYVKLLGTNQFVDLYVAEINRFLAARAASMAQAAK
jgi:hypothetical protein